MTRLQLSLIVLAVFLLLAGLMWLGYRNRARRQAKVLPAFPAVPDGLLDRLGEGELLPPLTGVYASTVTDKGWQDRVAVGDIGFRADATLHLLPTGLLFDRLGASPLWIPAESVVDARTEAGIAGKVMGGDGVLVVRWKIDGHQFDTGFRADDKSEYENWARAVRALPETPEVPHGE
ncbi:transporter [Actinokineospora sp. HUAS TT18]|uniref:PH-like domain-containing protein n=1 Tax=Actinokineospora sp. HUAS TT18 TaxID=3447451 RepID=UPI003F5237CC